MRLSFLVARICTSLAVAIALALPGPGLRAEESRQDWSRVQALPADQKIVVKPFKGMGPKVKGVYVSSDAERLIIRRQNGQAVTIPKDRIRIVLGQRRLRHAVKIGAVAGFALIASMPAAHQNISEILFYGGIGAGLGALGGLAARAAGKTYVVYQAENQAPGVSKTL